MNVITNTFNTTTDIASSAKESIQNNIQEFGTFLISNNIPQIAVAFLISTQVNRVGSDFIDNIISPIINRIIGQNEKTLKEKKIIIFGIQFETGSFFTSVLKFLLFLIILYYILKLIGFDKLKSASK